MYTTRDDALAARDSALNDDMGLDRALRIVRIFYIVYGKHRVAGKLLRELGDILIAIRQRARERHQEAEAWLQE